ncbi:hypothetical protein ACJX0J_030346 [Zea mays]
MLLLKKIIALFSFGPAAGWWYYKIAGKKPINLRDLQMNLSSRNLPSLIEKSPFLLRIAAVVTFIPFLHVCFLAIEFPTNHSAAVLIGTSAISHRNFEIRKARERERERERDVLTRFATADGYKAAFQGIWSHFI